jgi:hypothetical protein
MDIAKLNTTAEIEQYVAWAYNFGLRLHTAGPGVPVDPRLPLAVAEPGVLMERAVCVVGDDGLTRQELRRIFKPLSMERFARGLAYLRQQDSVTEQMEMRPNKAGRPQRQLVIRPVSG